jgi:hypothetical protein
MAGTWGWGGVEPIVETNPFPIAKKIENQPKFFWFNIRSGEDAAQLKFRPSNRA